MRLISASVFTSCVIVMALLPSSAIPASSVSLLPQMTAQQGQLSHHVRAYGALPLSFEVNRGQAPPVVKFIANGAGYTAFFTNLDAIFAPDASRSAPNRLLPSAPELTSHAAPFILRPLGASKHLHVHGLGLLAGHVNYLRGSDPRAWHTNIPVYQGIEYSGVYQGIDLVYRGAGGQPEYDWILHPGARASMIDLRVSGSGTLRLEHSGSLVLTGPNGTVREMSPVVYELAGKYRRRLSGRFILLGMHEIGFRVGGHDPTHPLIIDPRLGLGYATTVTGTDAASGIAVDRAGFVYMDGETTSARFPTRNAYQSTSSGGPSTFILKLRMDKRGTEHLVYATYLGGNGDDEVSGFAIDRFGNAYVDGYTTSTDFPVYNAYQSARLGSTSAFFAELSPAGNRLLYSTYLGGRHYIQGTHDTMAQDMAVDGRGMAYVVGYTASTDLPVVRGYQAKDAGGGAAFLVQIDPRRHGKASLIYSSYLGAGGFDSATGVAVDRPGVVWVTGLTGSLDLPLVNPLPWRLQRDDEGAFVAQFSTMMSGMASLLYSTYLPTHGFSDGMGIASHDGKAYVVGSVRGTDFPTRNAFQPDYHGKTLSGDDAFLTVLDPARSGAKQLVYSSYFGGHGLDGAGPIVVDSAGRAYFAGDTTSTDFPLQHPYQSSSPAGSGFVAVVDPWLGGKRSLVFSTYLGGAPGDGATSIALDARGNILVAGGAQSPGFPFDHPSNRDGLGGAFLAVFIPKLVPECATVSGTFATGGGRNAYSSALSGVSLDLHIRNATGLTTGYFVWRDDRQQIKRTHHNAGIALYADHITMITSTRNTARIDAAGALHIGQRVRPARAEITIQMGRQHVVSVVARAGLTVLYDSRSVPLPKSGIRIGYCN